MVGTTRRDLLALGSAAASGLLLSASGAHAEPNSARHHNAPSLVGPTVVPPEPMFRVPLRKRDFECVSEGWHYGPERAIHGFDTHKSLDLNAPYGAPILAPADGWALRTYQSWLTPTVYRDPRTGRTGRIGFGLGLWLITMHYVPEQDVYWFTKIAHCKWIDPNIHYLQSTVDSDGDWHEPNSLYVPNPELAAIATPIRAGDKLAEVGVTGIEFITRDVFDPATGQVEPRDIEQNPVWDADIHVHLEIYRQANGSPKPGETYDATRLSVDPMGHYGQCRPWERHDPYNDGRPLGPGHVLLTDRRGRPLFAG